MLIMILQNFQKENCMLSTLKIIQTLVDSTIVKFETKVIKSNICDYSDPYIFVTGVMQQQEVVMLILELHLKIVLIYEMHNSYKR